MKRIAGFAAVLLLGGMAFAQHAGSGGNVRSVNGGFGNVAFPGGGHGAAGHVSNGFGNVVFPGVSRAPGSISDPTFGSRLGRTVSGVGGNFTGLRNHGQAYVYVPYAYPVYAGSGYGYDGSYYDQGAQQQQTGTVVVYPPQAPPVTIINQIPPSAGQSQLITVPESSQNQDANSAYQPSASSSTPDNGSGSYYLIAFKDHSIYSAIAYWAEGDTLHYFTAGNVHNQASMSLVDKELTERLNKERSIDIRMPR